MALIFMDSCGDGYATADLPKKYSIVSTPDVQATEARTGGKAIQMITLENITRGVPQLDTYIIGAAFRLDNSAYRPWFFSFQRGTARQILVGLNTLTGVLSIERQIIVSSNELLASAAVTLPLNTWFYVEARVFVSQTVGTVDVYLNGSSTPALSFSGNTQPFPGTPDIDNIRIGSSQQPGVGGNMYVDDVYICDTTGSVNNAVLGDVRVDALFPTADGTTTTFATTFPASPTTHWDKVDEISPDGDTSYNESSTPGELDLVTLANLPAISGGGSVKGIQINIVSRKDDAGARSIREVTRTAATNYTGDTVALATGYTTQEAVRQINPNTGVLWTEAAVDAIEVGYEVI